MSRLNPAGPTATGPGGRPRERRGSLASRLEQGMKKEDDPASSRLNVAAPVGPGGRAKGRRGSLSAQIEQTMKDEPLPVSYNQVYSSGRGDPLGSRLNKRASSLDMFREAGRRSSTTIDVSSLNGATHDGMDTPQKVRSQLWLGPRARSSLRNMAIVSSIFVCIIFPAQLAFDGAITFRDQFGWACFYTVVDVFLWIESAMRFFTPSYKLGNPVYDRRAVARQYAMGRMDGMGTLHKPQ